jgi:hypothetical protein
MKRLDGIFNLLVSYYASVTNAELLLTDAGSICLEGTTPSLDRVGQLQSEQGNYYGI